MFFKARQLQNGKGIVISGTKAIVTGDVTQIDLPRKGDSGLVHALGLLERVEGVFECRLDARDVVRSAIARRIIEAYESE